MPPAKLIKTERTHAENQERAYIAASRRSDRPLSGRIESARKASEVHKMRTGRSLRITEEDVANEEMYEEEDDHLPDHLRRFNNGNIYKTNSIDFNRRLQQHLALSLGMRQAMPGFYGPPDPNTEHQPFLMGAGNIPMPAYSSSNMMAGQQQQQQDQIMRQQQELQMMQSKSGGLGSFTGGLYGQQYPSTNLQQFQQQQQQQQQQQSPTFSPTSTTHNQAGSITSKNFDEAGSMSSPQYQQLQMRQKLNNKRPSMSISTDDASNAEASNKRRSTMSTSSDMAGYGFMQSPSIISPTSPAMTSSSSSSSRPHDSSRKGSGGQIKEERHDFKRRPSFPKGAFASLRQTEQEMIASQRAKELLGPLSNSNSSKDSASPQQVGSAQTQSPNAALSGHGQGQVAEHDQQFPNPYQANFNKGGLDDMSFDNNFSYLDPMSMVTNPYAQQNPDKLQLYASLAGLNSTLAPSAPSGTDIDQSNIAESKYFKDAMGGTPGLGGNEDEFFNWDDFSSSQT